MLHYNIDQWELQAYVDIPAAIDRLRGNHKIYAVLLRTFLSNPIYDELQEAMHNGRLAHARDAAHSIRGTAANLSLLVLQQGAAELESQLSNGVLDHKTFELFLADWAKTQCYVRYVLEQIENGVVPA